MKNNIMFGGISFNCGDRYKLIKLVGTGAYGSVVLAYDLQNKNHKVAIKKLNLIEDAIDAKRILREIKIQRSMNHHNILKIYDIIYDQKPECFGDIYIVSPYFPADLHKIIKSNQDLSVEHVQFIMYQLCKGLYYLHSSGSIHRDIKPGNILANENCEVCYCDFGFARKKDEIQDQIEENMTEYVVTRHYRAPEIMLSSQQYSKPVDIWSLGCTFAELMTRKILFNAPNYIQMIKMFFDILGRPSDEELNQLVTNENALSFIETLPHKPKQPASKSVPFPDAKARDLLDQMLEMNPKNRITAQKCLEHPFFESIRNQAEEITFTGNLECDFENDDAITLESLKYLILIEINHIKANNKEELINIEEEMIRIGIIKQNHQ
ncbi:unnamed protein product [Paramecium pentaurelia]|uniref:Protein kinase domain-containing protein n=1 Tax=Paramecium pentaurelia TaxID=43138 RepID=A0A8S1U147_9CILI|nr:unnamed protein product [Paramecium pentaurelia]